MTKRTFTSDESGASAVEFALVSGLLIMTIVFVMTAALIMYYTLSLDYAANKAARQVMTGAAQTSGMSQTTFITQAVCGNLPSIFKCPDVVVNLQTVTPGAQPGGYYQFVNSNATQLILPALSNASTQYSPGRQSSYEYLQVIYPITFLPTYFASILSGGHTYKGSPAFLIVATAAFRNEQY